MGTLSTAEPPPAVRQGKLLCILGLGFGWAVTVGGTIAMGILRTPREVAANLPNVWLYMGAWVVGGLFALAGAVSVAELAAMSPRSGGPFLLTRRVLGRYPGFLVGWSDWLNWCGSCAAMALVVGEYSAQLFPALAGRETLVGLVVLLGAALLQWRGLRGGSRFQAWTSLIKALAFLALILCCLIVGNHSPAPDAVPRPVQAGFALAAAVVFAMQGVMFTYSGWEITTYFGEEVKDPGRTIPRSLIGSTALVIGIYLLFNAALLSVLSLPELAEEKLSAGAAAGKVFGEYGATAVGVLAIISLLAGLTAGMLLTPRILYALGREGLFFRQATRVNRGGTPDVALLLSALAGVLFLFSGTFERMLAVLAFIVVANYGLLFLAVFVCRWREPNAERPYRAWGYPWTTAVGLVCSAVFLVGAVVADAENSVYALVAWAVSCPLFFFITRSKPARSKDIV
jgi:APA family basic amino acid/polyamine antiporter